MLSIVRVVVSMMLKIEKQQLLRNTPGSCGVENLLDEDYDSRKYLTLRL